MLGVARISFLVLLERAVSSIAQFPLIEAGGDTVKRAEGAGQRAADGTVFVVLVGAGDSRRYRQTAVGELRHAGVFVCPLDTEIKAIGILHFGNNRLHQHLRAADIELGDHPLKIVHHVRRRGDDQGVGLAVGFDNNIFVDRGHWPRRFACRSAASC